MAKPDTKAAPAAEESKALTTTAGETAVESYNYGEAAGVGFEGVKSTDLSIPFLAVLQGLSPQVEKNDPPGSRPGLLFNTVTKELIDGEKGIIVVPCHKDLQYVEWIPRKKGGGFVGLHSPDSPEVKAAEEAHKKKEGKTRVSKIPFGENELVETHYVYALVLEEDGLTPAGFVVISFNSTKIKPCRDWFTSMYLLRGKPPIFANRARIKTVKQQNDQGVFFNFSIEPWKQTWLNSLIHPKNEEALLKATSAFRDMVLSGVARAAYETEGETGGPAAEAAGGADGGSRGGAKTDPGKPPF